jgi:hypothetical protein
MASCELNLLEQAYGSAPNGSCECQNPVLFNGIEQLPFADGSMDVIMCPDVAF